MKNKNVLIQMLYPQNIKCVVCGKDLFDESYGICSGCLPKANVRFCRRCGRAIIGDGEFCDDCTYGRNFTQARAPFLFEGTAKKIIYGLKYGGKKYMAPIIAHYLKDTFIETGWQVDFVTFVPMHEKRLKVRGYNQARLIATELSNLLGLPLVDTLVRTKYSDNFAHMGRKERFEEAEASFEAKERYDGKRILLIDDVFTTGATTGGCGKALLKSGAKDVFVLTFCTALQRPDLF